MIIHNVYHLIQEVQQWSTLERIFRYGIGSTLGLAIFRGFNSDVLNYFRPLLEKIDETVQYFDKTEFPASRYINRADIGELYNISKTQLHSDDNIIRTFLSNIEGDEDQRMLAMFFFNTNELIALLFRCYIDELVQNNVQINGITSVSSLLSANYNSKSKQVLQNLIDEYTNALSNKPTSVINVFSSLKREYLTSKFISMMFLDLDQKVTKYIAKKLEITSSTSVMRSTAV